MNKKNHDDQKGPLQTQILNQQMMKGEGALKNTNGFLHQLLYLQYYTNQQLILNEALTTTYINQVNESNGRNIFVEGYSHPGSEQKRNKNKNEKRRFESKNSEKRKKQRGGGKRLETESGSEYDPSDQQKQGGQYKLSESKNVPKIYGKFILRFVRKHKKYVKKVLQNFGKDTTEFQQFILKYKNNINTIFSLRSLWIQSQENKFAKQLRIISTEYLRKHALQQIFNSRVENFAKHIKYRRKILQAIMNPQQFTQMKDF